MERAALLRSLSCTSLASNRFYFRSFVPRAKFSSSSVAVARRNHHRLINNLTRRSLLRGASRLHLSLSSYSLQFNKHFSSLSPRAVASPSTPSSPEVAEVSNEVAEKLGFEKVLEEFIGECKSKAVLFKHKKTGAEVMSVSNDDENKVFGIVFRTPPKDSTGIPHILEHSVLCGSRKYPLKEPFVELLKGSLNTFLNAFTYPDRTCYPVASTNTKDFYNLVDVYLDAVFFPKCVEDFQTFQQEGWHFELDNPSEDITYKGVVFNEMKGVYSQPDNILGRAAQQALFPDNAYGVDSGGDPKVIPKLTFEEFKEFHRKYYHPSNARIWFYGDDDPNERLRILSEYLNMFEASSAPNESIVEKQKLFSEPVRIIEKYPAGDAGDIKKKNMVCLNWLLSDKPLDLETELALGFLDHLMLGTPASPLRKILLESGLGDAIVGGGIEDELLQPQFSIGLKNVSEDDIQKVEELIMDTLKKLADEGFDSDAVEASMNTIEFSLRENNTGSFPRGLSLMLRSMGKWIYDMNPFEPLKYEKPLMALKARLAEEGPKAVFSPLIEKYILNNPHCVTVEMQPDPEKASRDEAAEKEILAKVKSSMAKEDLAELARATEELRLKQETPDPPEALRSVPSLSLRDIPKEPIRVPTEVGDINGVKVLQHDLFTNDVLYTEVVFDMSSLKQELLPLIPLFCQSLKEMGTKDLSFVQLDQLIGRKTGGISVYPFTSSIHGKEDPCCCMVVRGKAMAGQAEDLFNLFNCVLQEVQLTDQQRFKQFVSQSKARMENRLRGSGHGIAAARMDAKLNTAGWISEQMGGVSYLEFLQALEEKVDQDWAGISSSLEEIRRSFLSREGCLINITADGKNLKNSERFVGKFLDMLPTNSPVERVKWKAHLPSANEAIVIPTQVNYVGKAANIFETGYKLNGSAYVISKHISNVWLWDRVRVSGGAYGGFCDFDSHSGVFSFLSYRDPNLLKTLDIYDGTVDFLRELEMDDDTLTKAIIGTIGDVDAYQLPDAKGYSSLLRHLLGITEEERQRRREEILSTSLKDFKEFADVLEAIKDRGVAVAVASPDDVDAANKERANLFEVKKAL
ncbi:presequence protease 2 [Citrus sinensis]|uniref:presequence protease 2, chloroplastic/mitochondrial isoform X1 n=1 Tax=Citrus sinensis TaxID=2711 RepID=UPI0021915936|nr:presequence protease 2, chloroplastic/mitochondrial isoform X1 [Citrus sinensis]KAH9656120.1 presequence protease 2 [Citrus sinensis]